MNDKLQHLPNIKQPEKIHSHVCSAADIALDSDACHIIVLAGIGGLTLLDIISTLYQNYQLKTEAKPIFLALCPNHHSYALRQFLRQHNFALVSEQYVYENGQSHEVIVVKSPGQLKPTISSVGGFWQADNPQQMQYLNKLLQHYRNLRLSCATTDEKATDTIIQDYQAIKNTVMTD